LYYSAICRVLEPLLIATDYQQPMLVGAVTDGETVSTSSGQSHPAKNVDIDAPPEEVQPPLVALAVCALVIMLIVVVLAAVLLLRYVRQCGRLFKHRRAVPVPPFTDDIEMTPMHPEHRPVQATSDQFTPSPVGTFPFSELVRQPVNSSHGELGTGRQNSV